MEVSNDFFATNEIDENIKGNTAGIGECPSLTHEILQCMLTLHASNFTVFGLCKFIC